jgi:hypothetical protein
MVGAEIAFADNCHIFDQSGGSVEAQRGKRSLRIPFPAAA